MTNAFWTVEELEEMARRCERGEWGTDSAECLGLLRVLIDAKKFIEDEIPKIGKTDR